MNELGLKQKAVFATLGMVVLYAIAAATWFLSAEKSWKKSAKTYEKTCDTYAREVELIGRKAELAEEYESVRSAIPTFAGDKTTDTTWLSKVSAIARKHKIVISQSDALEEVQKDEVLVLPIKVGAWEGSLEALVRFMHELENSDEGIFEVSQLEFKPSSKKGYYRGSFVLNCGYMREN